MRRSRICEISSLEERDNVPTSWPQPIRRRWPATITNISASMPRASSWSWRSIASIALVHSSSKPRQLTIHLIFIALSPDLEKRGPARPLRRDRQGGGGLEQQADREHDDVAVDQGAGEHLQPSATRFDTASARH